MLILGEIWSTMAELRTSVEWQEVEEDVGAVTMAGGGARMRW